MASQNGKSGGQVSNVLLLIVGLLAGFIGGYAIAHQGSPATGIAPNALAGASTCQYELDPADQGIIAGFICPAPECTDPLLGCHCETAHQIKQRVKNLLASGVSPDEARTQIQAEYSLK
jgi:hypothetical protein